MSLHPYRDNLGQLVVLSTSGFGNSHYDFGFGWAPQYINNSYGQVERQERIVEIQVQKFHVDKEFTKESWFTLLFERNMSQLQAEEIYEGIYGSKN